MTNFNLNEATKMVVDEIRKEEDVLRKKADTECQDPIMVEGETTNGYYCQLMVNPQTAARIMLRHNYHIYHTLGEDAPDAMWQELADEYGLATVTSVDL